VLLYICRAISLQTNAKKVPKKKIPIVFTRERATPFLTLTGVFDEQPLRDKSPIDVADVLRGKEAAQRVGGEGAEGQVRESGEAVGLEVGARLGEREQLLALAGEDVAELRGVGARRVLRGVGADEDAGARQAGQCVVAHFTPAYRLYTEKENHSQVSFLTFVGHVAIRVAT